MSDLQLPVRLLRSAEAGHVPASLLPGQIAINEADGLFFYRSPTGEVLSFNPADLLARIIALENP